VPPLLPFNLGSLGFLTPFAPQELAPCLEKAVQGKFMHSLSRFQVQTIRVPGSQLLLLGTIPSGGFPLILRHRLHCIIVRAKCRRDAAKYPDSPAKWEDGHCASEKVCSESAERD